MNKFLSSLLVLTVILTVSGISADALDIKGGLKSAASSVKSSADANASKEGIAGIKAKVDALINRSDKITDDFTSAYEETSEMLGLKELIEKTKAEKADASKEKANKEQDSSNSNISDASAYLASEEAQKELAARIKSLSAEKKAKLIKCLENMGNAVLGYADITAESANLLQVITNDPAAAIKMGTKLKELKKVAVNTPKQAKLFGSAAKNLVSAAAKAGLKVKQPEAKKTKSKNANDDIE